MGDLRPVRCSSVVDGCSTVYQRELLDFPVSYTPVGNATFGAREGAHDDLILAVALAVLGLGAPQAEVTPLIV